MKNVVKYPIITFLVLLIFYGGAGINVMSYCCGDCRSEGVGVVLADKCCEIHDHHHEDQGHHTRQHNMHAHDDCTEHFCETDCCDLQRINFEWDHTTTPLQELQPVMCDLLPIDLPVASLLLALEDTEFNIIEQYSPPLIHCPRGYLSLLTTLLI